ncbi:hypothetical protein JCM11491_004941 [Sporobolomyces phaffii]
MDYTVPDTEHSLASPSLPNYFAWVEIDGEPVQVYSKTVQDDSKAVCYIEAIEGKHFTVCTADQRRTPPSYDWSVRVHVDGQRSPLAQTTEQKLLFGKLRTTDDDDVASNEEALIKNLGSIRVEYRAVKNLKSDPDGGPGKVSQAKPIHEKTKKAQLSHQAVFGERQERESTGWLQFDWVGGIPSHIFEFRYRSRQSSPRTSPAPLDLTDEGRQAEIDRLQQQIDALRNGGGASASSSNARKIKHEENESPVKKKPKVEAKDGPSSTSQGKGKGKEVIVLSDSE